MVYHEYFGEDLRVLMRICAKKNRLYPAVPERSVSFADFRDAFGYGKKTGTIVPHCGFAKWIKFGYPRA